MTKKKEIKKEKEDMDAFAEDDLFEIEQIMRRRPIFSKEVQRIAEEENDLPD